MTVRFKNLFNVHLQHEYFYPDGFNAIDVKPDIETEKRMLNLGLLFKRSDSGFSVFNDESYDQKDLSWQNVIDNQGKLVFLLTLNDRNFYNYTTYYGRDISQFSFLFTNLPSMTCQNKQQTFLHFESYVSGKDFTIRDENDKNLFGKIVIQVDQNLQQDYYIKFDQRETYLRYFLVTEYLYRLENPGIIDNSNEQTFLAAEQVEMKNNKNAKMLIAEKAMKFHNKAKSNLMLVNYDKDHVKYKLVKSLLPLPDFAAVSNAYDGNEKIKKNYTDIFL